MSFWLTPCDSFEQAVRPLPNLFVFYTTSMLAILNQNYKQTDDTSFWLTPCDSLEQAVRPLPNLFVFTTSMLAIFYQNYNQTDRRVSAI